VALPVRYLRGAAVNIGDVFFAAHLDDKGLGPEAVKAGETLGTTMGQRLSNKLSANIKTGVAAGATAAVASFGLGLLENAARGLGGAIADSIRAASDLNETIQKSHVVFGSSAGDIEAWGKTAATSMGLSENAAIGAAASIGNLLLSTGTSPAKIAPMSKALVGLASDLASFNNISVEDALAKLQSGLVGQERPLRELGVAISAASVDTEAAALGFHKLNGEFSEGEKVQARYALIFQQTATAQGDFARTADQLANTQRILNAEMDDASAKFGKSLTPAVTLLDKGLIQVERGLSDFAVKTEQVGEATGDFVRRGIEGWKQLLGITDTAPAAIDDVSSSLREVGHHAAGTGIGFRDLRTDAEKMAGGFTTAKSTADDLAGSLQRADTAATNFETTLSTKLYGAAISAGRRQELANQLAADEKALKDSKGPTEEVTKARERLRVATLHLAEVEANRNSKQSAIVAAENRVADAQRALTVAQQKGAGAALILKGAIAGDQQALMDIDYEIAKAKGPKALTDQLHAWEKQFKKTNYQAYLAVLALEKLDHVASLLGNVSISVSGGGKGGGLKFATGGSLLPGQHATVGEQGPEDLYNRGGIAVVVPRSPMAGIAGAMAGLEAIRTPTGAGRVASAPASVVEVGPITLYGIGSDVSAGAARGFGQRILDEVANGLRNQTGRGPIRSPA
jgi:hypothetical protein